MTRASRLIKRKRVATAFSGEGARLAGGRWNHVGTSVVYLSGSLSLAALELFVHLDSRSRDSLKLVNIPVMIPDDLVEVLDRIPRGWRAEPAPKETKDLGTAWANSGSSCVLRVPSAIIPEEFNYVVNPAHADFGMIVADKPERFSLDPRLWK